MSINNIKLKEYKTLAETVESILPDFNRLKITRHKNSTFDTSEITFKQLGRKQYRMFDRLSIEDNFFNWNLSSANITIDDKMSNTYNVQLLGVELTERFKNERVSNLAFNQFLTTNIYNNLFDIVERIRLLTPLELEPNVQSTRVWFGTNKETDPEWKRKGYTEKLYNALIQFTELKEYKFFNRNLYEVLEEIFRELKAVPRRIETEFSTSVLDIVFFDEEVGETNIDNWYYYEEIKNINNYATSAEITTNNIINENNNYTSGLVTGKVLQSEEFVFDEELAIMKLELPIYILIEAVVAPIESNSYTTITQNFKSDVEFKLLSTGRGSNTLASTQNSVMYSLGKDTIKGWGKQAKKNVLFQDTTVWKNMFADRGVPDRPFLSDYKFKVVYQVLQKDNRFNVKTLSFDDDNKRASIRINDGERVNEFTKIINATQTKLSRLNARMIIKKVKLISIDAVLPLGTYDFDTGFKIASYEIDITKGSVDVSYILTPDLNILMPETGVNSENGFTDTEIGGGLIRNEVYEDWIIFAHRLDYENSVIDTENTSSLTLEGVKVYRDLFVAGIYTKSYGHWHTSSTEIVSTTIIPTQIKAAANTISWLVPFLTPSFVDNEMTEIPGSNEITRLIDRGVPYTRGNGTLDALALTYGFDISSTTDVGKQRALPNAFDLVDLDSEPLITIGTTSIDIIPETVTVETGIIRAEYVVPVTGTSTGTVEKFYTLSEFVEGNPPTLFVTSIDIEWEGTNEADFGSLQVSVIDRFGNKNQVLFKLVSRTTIPGTTNILIPEFTLGESQQTKDSVNVPLNFEVAEIQITVFLSTEDSKNNIPRTDFVEFKNVVVNYNDNSPTTNNGLFVDKNHDEILSIEYMNHLFPFNETIIIGEALTTKSLFLNNDFNGFDEILVYQGTERYGKYDNSQIKGNQTSLILEVILFPFAQGFQLLMPEEYDDTKTWSVVGVKDNIHYLLVASNVDRTSKKSERQINIFFKHQNLKQVIHY